jgi:hypothetical protein
LPLAPPPCGLAPPPPLPVPLPPLLADEPLSCELEPLPLPLEDDALSCAVEPPPLLPLLDEGALSCELELLLLLLLLLPLLLLLEDDPLSCELEPPPPLLEDEALSCEGAIDALSEPPGCAATAGVAPATISASSAKNATSGKVLIEPTFDTRWSSRRFPGVDSHRAFMSDLLSGHPPAAWRPGQRRGGHRRPGGIAGAGAARL